MMCTTAGSDVSTRSRPTWFAPNRTTLRPERAGTQSRYLLLADRAPVRESNDNILNGSRPVRVQIVNAKLTAKKCGIKLYRRNFYENESKSAPGRTEAAAAAIGRGEGHGGNEFRADHRRNHHLSDTLAAPDLERRVAVIDQQHADLAAIIRVNRARRVQHGDAVLCGEAGTRTDLRLIPGRQRDRQRRGHQRVASRQQNERHILRNRGEQVEPGGVGALIGRQRRPSPCCNCLISTLTLALTVLAPPGFRSAPPAWWRLLPSSSPTRLPFRCPTGRH